MVMDTANYIAEIERQLSDTEVYKVLPGDPKWEFERNIQQIVLNAKDDGLIDESLSHYLIIKHPKTPALYVLPKIHKTLINPPGRPIVSGRESLFKDIGIFLDKVLRDFASGAKSYIRDTMDFLGKIRNLTLPENAILGTFDIVSLYTSIDHSRGIGAVQACLDQTEFNIRT